MTYAFCFPRPVLAALVAGVCGTVVISAGGATVRDGWTGQIKHSRVEVRPGDTPGRPVFLFPEHQGGDLEGARWGPFG